MDDEAEYFGGRVIAEGKALREYYDYLEDKEAVKVQNVKRYFFFEGNIAMEEVRFSIVHRMLAQDLIAQVMEHNTKISGERTHPLFVIGDYPITVGPERERSPDLSICHEPSLASMPSVAVEIFHSHGGVDMIRKVANFYLSPEKTFTAGINTFIAIKVMHPCPKAFCACAFVFQKKHGDLPVAIVSFGERVIGPQAKRHIAAVMDLDLDSHVFHGFNHSDVCDKANRKHYMIPLEHVEMSFSLYDLQRAIANALHVMPSVGGGRLDVDNLWEEH